MTGTDPLHVAGLALLVLLVPVILVVAALAIVLLDRRITRKRAAAFRAVAGAMGLEFRPQGIDGCWGDLSPFDLFQHGRTRWFRNVLHGVARGVEVCAFDYQYTVGSDRHPQCRHQTAVGFCTPGLVLPDFNLRLRAWGAPAGPWAPVLTREVLAGYRDIALEDRAEFSTRYRLTGTDEAAVRRSLPGELLDYLAAHPAVNVEAYGDRVLVYGAAVRATPEAIRRLIDAGFDVLAWLRPGDPADGDDHTGHPGHPGYAGRTNG